MQILEKNEQGSVSHLVKHSAAVHISNSLSLLERKIFNILLKNAFNFLLKRSEHVLRINDLSYQIGWDINSKQNEALKEALTSINGTQVTWNIFNKDKKNTWGVATLISGAEICNGVVTYRFDEKIRMLLANPSIYARLNLQVHQKFRSKYAYVLWEFFVEALCSYNTDCVSEYEISLMDLRKFLDVIDKYPAFKDLNRIILLPSLKEINKVSDIEVQYDVRRQSRKVSTLIFCINKKKEFQQEFDYSVDNKALDMSKELKGIGLSPATLKKIFRKYSVEQIEKAFDVIKPDLLAKAVRKPAAYFLKALEEVWQPDPTPQDNKPTVPTIDTAYEDAIEDKDWQQVRKKCIAKYGIATFNNWIKNLELVDREKGKVTLCAPTRFIKEWVENNYINAISHYWQEADSNVKNIRITVKKDT